LTKLNQWEKLHIFDDYFKSWQRVVFLDAGLRVLDDVSYLLSLDYKNKILAPTDGKHSAYNEFKCQLSYDKPEQIDSLVAQLGDTILTSNYMLNCIWIYDTSILDLCDKNQLIEAMNNYPFCKTNEMGIMNLLFHFKYHLWEPFPMKASNKKYLFDWCELNNPNTNWREYCCIKYPVTITFEDT
jgi:lipopolysaccharide biosynthesis glycosyltransferase